MASSLISSSHHIDFDSVFIMEDESLAPVIVLSYFLVFSLANTFQAFLHSVYDDNGIFEFLGCPAIFYEAALTEFFANGSVRNGVVVSTIGGTTVEISESVFTATFELPSEGLTDLSEVPKNMVFDARSLFSDSKEQAGSFDAVTRDRFLLMTATKFDVKINWSTLLFGVLKAMVTPGSKQAKGFAIQIGVVLSNIPGLELGKPRAFPPPRVLNERTVHRFVHINEQVGMEKTTGSPPMKKTPKKRAVSKKRPVDSDAEVAPIFKKKRTTKSKPSAAKSLPVEEPVSTTSEQPVAEVATGEQEPVVDDTTWNADEAIEQVLAQLDLVFKDSDVDRGDMDETWFYRALDEELENANQEIQDSEDGTTFDENIQELPVSDETRTVLEAGEKASSSKQSAEEHMSIDDLLMQISEDMLLPSVTTAGITKIRLGESINIPGVQERDLFYASLPRISIHDKGKEPLVEDETIRGNPARESVELICGDVDFLVQLRDRVMEDVVQFFHSFSLSKLTDFDGLKALRAK
ncbi:pyruvate, phosphate dikinase regulatory protein 2 [Dorcoceras hygrometricum]|uniref:Pyruvate, phosphate dikinase regulatory protein 2 n=1 Tax=Dorcoceras hygrometricum TaxID=472368 RepID=A0A2Z7C5T5_9LAMI|nr:pyruvate, phosphate dikinase regulatory protein 2 [Dorcoceras hygrometricum]